MMPPCLLAEVSLSDQPILLFIAMGALVGLISVGRNIIGAIKDWKEMKRNPEGAEYVTKSELTRAHDRVDTAYIEIGKIRGEVSAGMEANRKAMTEGLRDVMQSLNGIHRSLGQVEGMEKLIDAHTAAITELQRKD